jgi:trans-2,3-dihydro-3-hydroxyanthranilate isomerase
MPKTSFYLVDVFAEKKFAGNQLAVFIDAAELSSAEMQQIAREINFSETTFILDRSLHNGGFDVRIFTPRAEVPFAGHPTLGTAHIICNEILGGKAGQVLLNLKVGQIPVTFGQDGYNWMRQVEPTFGARQTPAALAAVLGLDMAAIDPRFPIEEVSTGLAFHIVPLKSLAALQSAKIDKERYFSLIENTEAKGILVFCPEGHAESAGRNTISVRVFVDYFGVPEDPATGSGNGCLAGYLAQHRYFGASQINVCSEQGYEIGRPSTLLLKAEEAQGKISILVGGKAITVAQGQLV